MMGMSVPDGATRTRSVLRARIEVDYPDGVDRSDVEDRIAAAITAATTQAGATVTLLQLALAAHPEWPWFGPPDRLTGDPLP